MDVGASSMMNFKMMNQECVKLDKFDGCTYTHWAEKMMFLLIVLKIYYVLDTELPPIPANPVPQPGKPMDEKKVFELKKQCMIRKEDKTLCCGHIKKSLPDTLYDLCLAWMLLLDLCEVYLPVPVMAISVISISSDSSKDSTDIPVIPTETPIIAPTIPPSPDYTPASPDYSLASDSQSDPFEDPSSDHIPSLPAISPFLSLDDDTTDSDTPNTPPSPTHDTPFTEITAST
ncbi:hypothetical protein Tco_0020434 [Tanacetum coccineum]